MLRHPKRFIPRAALCSGGVQEGLSPSQPKGRASLVTATRPSFRSASL